MVWLCPVIPFLNDTQENIRTLVESCADAGVKGIIQYGIGLTLREGNREYFYARLDKHWPGLKERYIRTYGNAYELPSPREKELSALVKETCEKQGILYGPDQVFAYLKEFEDKTAGEQLSLF